MRRKKAAADRQVHQLKARLKGIRPPIWRRMQVPSDIDLGTLHGILQETMGWDDGHMHEFRAGGISYGVPSPHDDVRNEDSACLADILPSKGSRLTYEYDFGDSWVHELLVEKIVAAEPGATYPVCLAGKRACPPEDCGGAYGYLRLIEIMADPSHPEHVEMEEWLGAPLEPEAFDVAAVNLTLRRIR